MTQVERYVSPVEIEHLLIDEQDYLSEIFRRFRGYPALEQVWELMAILFN